MNQSNNRFFMHKSDYGPDPYVVNIDKETLRNTDYRTALWTGNFLQVTLMSIPVDGEIGLEVHQDTDQFIKIVKGYGIAKMGAAKDQLSYQHSVCGGYAVFVPAGTWHNIINTGTCPMKIYTVYAPPHHPHGTVQATKAIADMEEH